ncbi:MAG: class III extradiol ring-cleavage dioxygenase [Gammaproteobacteria bacterium]|nr:MAG: class III extradiol ring-cleavage dioxygenase [Gammaproteobacteria bacterium]
MSVLPGIFVSHGAPTLLLEKGPTQDFLAGLGAMLPPPRAIVCISAHWETTNPRVTGAARPDTIHDFYGFPDALYRMRYPAPGDPALAARIAKLLQEAGFEVDMDESRGLDHGAWVPLMLAYPQADVPVVQLSIQIPRGTRHHLEIGKALAPLRAQGVLIMGSGGATHNLAEFRGQALDASPLQYVIEFDTWLENAIVTGDQCALLDYEGSAPSARRNHPTAEHFLPLFVALGATSEETSGRKLHGAFTYGVLSMAAYAWD